MYKFWGALWIYSIHGHTHLKYQLTGEEYDEESQPGTQQQGIFSLLHHNIFEINQLNIGSKNSYVLFHFMIFSSNVRANFEVRTLIKNL